MRVACCRLACCKLQHVLCVCERDVNSNEHRTITCWNSLMKCFIVLRIFIYIFMNIVCQAVRPFVWDIWCWIVVCCCFACCWAITHPQRLGSEFLLSSCFLLFFLFFVVFNLLSIKRMSDMIYEVFDLMKICLHGFNLSFIFRFLFLFFSNAI